MKSTKHFARAVPTPIARDPFEELRDAFRVRLRSDRVRLTTLGAELARAEDDPERIFEDMHQFAHRLLGASTIFEAHDIGIAADALEQAARSASIAHADNSDASVWTALECLVDRLASHTGPSPALDTESKVSRHADECERRSRR